MHPGTRAYPGRRRPRIIHNNLALAPGTRLGPYEILSALGAGGMGEVYRARDTRLNRDVAVKVLPQALTHDEPARARFRREALSAAALDHPFICKIFEIGDAGPRVFIVMEFVPGETLQQILTRGPLPAGEVVALALELTDALDAAHGRNIVHRDLKPGNIMVTPQRHAKLMDFGVAKVVGDASDQAHMATMAALTDQGTRVGTPAYMSPEQVAGDALDHRSDLFSLGVLLIETLTGVHPFMRNTAAATITAVLKDPPFAHAIAAVGAMPQSLRAILLRMLAKTPDARYQSASEVRSDLQSLNTSRPSGEAGGGPRTLDDQGMTNHRWAMVGRDAERAELGVRLEAALAGRGGVVLVGGEPGIGKTRLTEELLADARRRGATGVVGHCYEMQGAPPYVPFVEITEYTARVVPPAALRRLLGDDAAEVTRLMPELRRMFADIPGPIELPAEQQRWYFFKAYCSFVDRATRMAPIVAVFEDLHWADEPTLQLLLHVAQAASSMPLLVVGTYRDAELDVSRPFAKVLETLLRQRLATRMTLRRLPAAGVEALLEAMSGRPVPASFARVVFRETEGNPFFVEEVFQHLKEEGRLFASDGAWKPDLQVESLNVPEGVRLVIGRRLERLGENGRRILTAAAVIGRVFSLALLEDIESGSGSAGSDAVIDAIEEAERAHLVAAHAGGRDAQYKFAHELIRQTLADTLSLPRRQRLHARIAAAMEQRYASQIAKHTSALAHHLYQAGGLADPDKTTTYLIRAAGQARDAAGHEEALEYLDNAKALWDDDRSGRVADLLDRRSEALASLGRRSEALEMVKEAAALWRELGDDDRFAKSMATVTRHHVWAMDLPGGLLELNRALVTLSDASGTARALLLYLQAWFLMTLGLPSDSRERSTEADTLRAADSNAELDATALMVAADQAWGTWSPDAGLLQRRANEAFTALGKPWQKLDNAFKLVWMEAERGAVAEAWTLVHDLREEATRIGHHGAVWTMAEALWWLTFMKGDLASAEREARSMIQFARTHGIPWVFFSEMRLGATLACGGQVDEGISCLRRAAAGEGAGYYRHWVRATLFKWLAYVAPNEARAYLNATEIPLPEPGRINTIGRQLSLLSVAEGLHALGDREALAGLMPITETIPNADGRIQDPPAGAAAGLAAAAAGAWDIAESHFSATIARCDSIPVPLYEGKVREWYADMLTSRGTGDDHANAATLYAKAAANYERLALVTYARHLSEKLTRS